MSAANFTPGPWATGDMDPLLFGAKRGNGTEPIGFVYGPSFPDRSEIGMRALANARMAAAAPDLLAALVAAQAYVPPSSPVHQQIAAAIAHAKGTS